jgi:hypothetical protein
MEVERRRSFQHDRMLISDRVSFPVQDKPPQGDPLANSITEKLVRRSKTSKAKAAALISCPGRDKGCKGTCRICSLELQNAVGSYGTESLPHRPLRIRFVLGTAPGGKRRETFDRVYRISATPASRGLPIPRRCASDQARGVERGGGVVTETAIGTVPRGQNKGEDRTMRNGLFG